MKRRNFIKGLAFSGAFPTLLYAAGQTDARQIKGFGELVNDPRRILNLPDGFRYGVISVLAQDMEDGRKVPGWPDGMHAFPLDSQRIIILCNHELDISQHKLSAWQGKPVNDRKTLSHSYDRGSDGLPAPGGVRRMVYNLKTHKLERQHMALLGTVRNCSGGATPWGSWISCEESVLSQGQGGLQQSHGYCFEVPANKTGIMDAKPLKAMGRFNHEAAAVDPDTGIIYQTEDRPDGLFYRFIPNKPKVLRSGGRLQALALDSSKGSVSTGNRGEFRTETGKAMSVHWVDIDNVESPKDDLRYQGQKLGATRFVRGEGMVVERGEDGRTKRIWIMCTTGGVKGYGQIFYYQPSPQEGKSQESESPGMLTLFSEPNNAQLLLNGDNITLMPNGDLLVCEDSQQQQRLIGVTPTGEYYVIASNARSASEFTGATFSPDGSTLFVNLQQQGGTVAIVGPWNRKVVDG